MKELAGLFEEAGLKMSNIIRLLAESPPRISDGNENTDVWVNDMKFKMAYSF